MSSKAELTSETTFQKSSSRDKFVLGVVIVAGLGLVIGLAVGIPLSKRDAPQVISHDPLIAEANTFLETNILIDGHNDLPWQYRQYAKNKVYTVHLDQDTRIAWPVDLPLTDDKVIRLYPQTDIPRLRAGRVGAQWWAAFVHCRSAAKDAVRQGFDQVDVILKFTKRYPESFTLALSADEIESVFASGRIASLIGLEGGHMIGNSLGNLRMHYMIGVRYMTLTHSCDTDWADNYNADTNGGVSTGLTDFGRIVVREMNRLGMIIDLSHVSYKTMKDAIDESAAPIIFSHSSVFTRCNHYRNVQDDVLDKMKVNGGIIMINFYNGYINCAPNVQVNTTISQVVEHIQYVRNRLGVEYVAIGADYDGVPELPQELEDVSTYPKLFAKLIDEGWTTNDLKKLAGENLLRVFRAVEKVRDDKVDLPPYEDLINEDDIKYPNCTTGI